MGCCGSSSSTKNVDASAHVDVKPEEQKPGDVPPEPQPERKPDAPKEVPPVPHALPGQPQRPPEDEDINGLLDAAENGEIQVIVQGVQRDPHLLNRRPEYREYTALQQVAASGNHQAVEVMLRLRPDLGVKCKKGRTAAEVAEDSGHREIAVMLREAEKEGDVNDAIEAAERGDVATVVLAAQRSPAVLKHRPQYREHTALGQLAALGHQEGVEALLRLRADPAVRSKGGMTAAQVAELSGHEEMAEMLRKAEKEGAINDFLDLAETGDAGAVVAAATQNPSLLNGRPQYRSYTAVQVVAAAGDEKAILALLDLNPDLSVLAKDGRLASEVAEANGHGNLAGMLRRAELGKRLLQEEAVARQSKRGRQISLEKPMDDIEERKPPRSFIGNYVRAVMFAPLIGKRAPWDKKPIEKDTGRRVAEGLRKEARLRAEEGQDSDLRVFVNSPPAHANPDRHGKVDIAETFETCEASLLPNNAIWAFTTESFVDGAIYKAMRDSDESRDGLAPIARILDDTFAENRELKYWDGPCYRVRRMQPDMAAHYEPCEPPGDGALPEADPTTEQRNVFAWDGFTACCCDPDVVYEQYNTLKANTLVVITPRTAADRPIDLRHMSDWGDNEAQVVFNVNQQFSRRSVAMRPSAEVWRELGVEAGYADVGDMRVIRCESIDAFYEFGAEIVFDGSEEAEAIDLLRSRIELEKERHGPDSENVCVAMRCLGKAYRLLNRYDESVAVLEREMEITLRVFGSDSPHAAKSYQAMGTALMYVGEHERSLDLLQKCIDIRSLKADAFGDKNQEHMAMCYSNMGGVLLRQEKFEEALELVKKSLHVRLEASGEKDLEVATSYLNMAECFRMMGRSEEALTHQEKGIAVRKEILGPQDPSVADGLASMALALTNVNRREEAMDAFQEALKIVEQQPNGHRSEKAGMIWNGMGFLEQGRKNWAPAVEHFEHALDIWTERLGPNHPNTEYVSGQLHVTKEKLRKHIKKQALHEQHEREREEKRLSAEPDATDVT